MYNWIYSEHVYLADCYLIFNGTTFWRVWHIWQIYSTVRNTQHSFTYYSAPTELLRPLFIVHNPTCPSHLCQIGRYPNLCTCEKALSLFSRIWSEYVDRSPSIISLWLLSIRYSFRYLSRDSPWKNQNLKIPKNEKKAKFFKVSALN